jgi:hypothetical protein
MHIQPIIPFKAIQESKVITKLKDAVTGVAKRELKEELESIRGNIKSAKKTIKSDIEGKQQRINEISDLKGKGLVSLKGDLMNELRRRTELMEVVTETPVAEDSDEDDKELKTESDKRKSILEKIIIESPKDDLKDKQP